MGDLDGNNRESGRPNWWLDFSGLISGQSDLSDGPGKFGAEVSGSGLNLCIVVQKDFGL